METAQVQRLMVEVTRLNTMIQEVQDALTAQQVILSKRNIHLDPGMMLQLGQVYGEIQSIQAKLTDQAPELAQLRALVRAMSLINSTLDLDQILNDVMDTFVELTSAERGFIVLLDPETHAMEFRVVRGMDENIVNKTSFMVSRTMVENVVSSGQPLAIANALEDSRLSAADSIVSYAPRSIICVPLKVKGEVIGVAYSDHRYRQGIFGEHETQFLAGFANQAAIAIENARLFVDVQNRLAEITEIRNFLDSIFSSIISGVITLDTNGIVMTTNRAAQEMFGIRAEDVIGQQYTQVFPGLYEGFETTLGRVRFEGGQQIIELNTVLPERGPVILNLKLSPLLDDENHIQGVAIVIDDVTDIRKHDETIRVVNTYLSEEMVKNIENIDNLGLGGEDREISALFADVRNFTTFSEQLEPEEVMTVINQYLSVSSDAVQATQGIIDKFMGDAVLALYNTQLNPQDNHALRAVQAAILMRDNVLKLHGTLPPSQQLFYGIGIHTGLATIGNVGSPSRKEFTAIGEAVLYTKKLQECADRGEILISDITYEQVKHAVECEHVQRQMRGETEYRSMYVVHRLKA